LEEPAGERQRTLGVDGRLGRSGYKISNTRLGALVYAHHHRAA
jgi:hypothetical protein